MSNKIRRQHYVWRKYLQPWTTKGKIWCRRNSAIYSTALMNVAQERDFYVPEPLNDVEKKLLRMDAASTKRPDIIQFVEDEITLREVMFAALDAARASDDAKDVERLETFIHNSEEEYQGLIEADGLANLAELVAGRINWAADEGRWRKFILFYATQYLRTKRIQERIKRSLSANATRMGYSVERVFSVQRNFEVVRLCDGIYRTASLTLLRADGGTEFITCDQPAFNVHAALSPIEAPKLPHEFYYPVSPNYAVVMMEGQKHVPVARVATSQEVERYNEAMRAASLEQVFARRREAFETTWRRAPGLA